MSNKNKPQYIIKTSSAESNSTVVPPRYQPPPLPPTNPGILKHPATKDAKQYPAKGPDVKTQYPQETPKIYPQNGKTFQQYPYPVGLPQVRPPSARLDEERTQVQIHQEGQRTRQADEPGLPAQDPRIIRQPRYSEEEFLRADMLKFVRKTDSDSRTDPRITDPRITDPRITDPRVTDPRIADPRITDPRITDNRITDNRISDNRIPEGRISEGRITDVRIADGRISDGRIADGRITEGRITEGRITDGRIADGRITETRNTDPRAADPRTDPRIEARIADPRNGDLRNGDPRIGDPRIGDPRIGDPRIGDSRIGDPRIGDSRIGDSRIGDPRIGDPRLGDPRIGDPRIGDLRIGDPRIDPRVSDLRITDLRIADPRMMNDPRLLADPTRHMQSLLAELRSLKEANQRLGDDNQELRDLCCFLDDDRQKGRKLAREWQRFGRYTASVMRQEVSAYQSKLRELDNKQQELIKDNLELKELCLYLDEERGGNSICPSCGSSSGVTVRDDGDGSSSSTNADEPAVPAQFTTGNNTPRRSASRERLLHENLARQRSTFNDQIMQYVRNLEQRVNQLEDDKRALTHKINQIATTTGDPSLAIPPDSGGGVLSGRPEAVVRALQVLEVREQLERDTRGENMSDTAAGEMDEGEKALVREMCNVVWRKLEEGSQQRR